MEFKGKVEYTLKNDYMFKAVLQKSEKVLKGLTGRSAHCPICAGCSINWMLEKNIVVSYERYI